MIDGRRFSAPAASGGRRANKSGVHLHDLKYWNPGTKLPDLFDSVGDGGANRTDDVKTVQALLNMNGANLDVDGKIGPRTIGAIGAFQTHARLPRPDGRVDKGGTTWKLLLVNTAGGPIPPGKYRMAWDPNKFSEGCIRLHKQHLTEMFPGTPTISTIAAWKERNGMLIHGRGRRGSDGCIVPYRPEDLHTINAFVKSQAQNPILTVVDPFIPARVFDRIDQRMHTA